MPLLWIAFFFSGFAGLSYELTWFRYLTHLFGASAPAVSATVAIFLGGLAFGAAVGGRFFDRRERPLRAYAALEALIGLVALSVPTLFQVAETLLAGRVGTVTLFIVATAVLILPTTLLGATFPAMAAVSRRHPGRAGATATFYGLNTLGAVAGLLMAAFWALPTWGLGDTNRAMAFVNIGVALVLVVADRRRRTEGAPAGVAPPPDAPPAAPVAEAAGDDGATAATRTSSVGLGAAALFAVASGFLAIAIEVLWVRAFVLSFPGTVYVFAVVLAAFLIGIGAGSLVVAAAFRRRAPSIRALALSYLFAGIGCAAAQAAIPALLPWSTDLLETKSITDWIGYVQLVAGAALGIMLPASLAMGAALPLLIGLATRAGTRARTAGRLYALNTIGGVAGSIAATYVAMPALGLDRSATLVAIGYTALAAALAFRARHRILGAACALLATVALGVTALGADPSLDPAHADLGRVILRHDSPAATLSVYETDDGVRGITVNATYVLSNTEKRTVSRQYRLGFLPMLAHGAPRRALLIGFATGATLAAMAESETLDRLDCAEILGSVVDVAPHFAAINHRVWEDENVHLMITDGRRLLMKPGAPYDVIVSDLYSPRSPGVGALYSREHFARVAERLAPDGIFVCWLPLWQMGKAEFESIVRSFHDVFPEGQGWVGDWSRQRPVLGLAAFGPEATPNLDLAFERKLALATRALLRESFPDHRGRFDLDFPTRPAGRGFFSSNALRAIATVPGPRNTLDTPFVEFNAPQSLVRERLRGGVPLGLINVDALGRVQSLDRSPWRDVPHLLERIAESTR